MARQAQPKPPHNPLPLVDRAVGRLTREITQAQIQNYAALLKQRAEAKAELEAVEADLVTYEKFYLDALRKGFTQEAGDLHMHINEMTRQAPVAWKEMFARVAGPSAVEEAQQAAGVRTYPHVNVTSTTFAQAKQQEKDRSTP